MVNNSGVKCCMILITVHIPDNKNKLFSVKSLKREIGDFNLF